MANVETTLEERLAALISAMGYEFVGCEFTRAGRSGLLRVYIDNASGITLADCTKVSHQVSAMLDVDDPVQGEYHLEISSPGLDRPLFGIAQFRKVIGSRIKVRMYNPLNNQRNFVGILQQVDNVDDIHLLMDAEEVILPFSGIEKARVIPDRE